MSACPNSAAAGCRCVEHHPGVLGLAVQHGTISQAAADATLNAIRGPLRLHVVTTGPTAEIPCDGTLTCGCVGCLADKAEAVRRGGQGAGPSSPFRRAA